MTGLKCRSSLIRLVFPVLAGAFLGGFLGFASAQEGVGGRLDPQCAARCAANGNETAFCAQVCWAPDPEVAARNEPVDWRCYSSCRERGGRAADCMASCRHR